MRALAAALLLGFTSAPAQQPENVFIVVIDGLRNDEGFQSGSLQLPHIWNDLRPQGTVNLNFWDRGWTATTGGHTTILSGVYQILRNNGSNEQDIRSFDPLLFEYYRKHFYPTDTTECGITFGKLGNVGAIADFALEPAYGETYQGFQRGDGTTHDDTASSRLLHQAMDSLHPRLVMLNLADVDTKGHAGVYADYLASIVRADSVVYEIWKHIQGIPPYTNTSYRDKTVLVVTSDHGRNDDAHGSFLGHGEWDHGSRQVGFLAIGAGIAQNRTVTARREQIDIAPTVGYLLGFPTPFSEGAVMHELFAAGLDARPGRVEVEPVPFAANLSNNAGFSRDPDICRDRGGNLYLVWSDSTPGRWGVLLRKSTDSGQSWGPTSTLFNYPKTESVMWYCRVAADDSLAVAAIGIGRHLNYVDSVQPSRLDTTFIWYPWLATSSNGGASWTYASLRDSSMGSWYPGLAVKNGRVGVAWWAVGQFAWQALPRNGIFFNHRDANGTWQASPTEPSGRQAIHVSLQDDGGAYHLAASAFDGQDFDIGYWRSTNAGSSWTTLWLCQDPDGTPAYDYDPELVVDYLGWVHLFWARKPNTGGAWQVMYGRRDPGTGVFDTFRLTSSPAGAWQPHAAVKADTVMLVWIDYRDGNPEVYSTFSPDRGVSWSAPERVSWTEALSHHPRVCASGRGFYCVWQDLASGNWEVYGRELSTYSGRDAGITAVLRPAGSFDSLSGVTPAVTVRNYGPMTATVPAVFTIRDAIGAEVYRDTSEAVDVAPGGSATVSFRSWPPPRPCGGYTARCTLVYAGDNNPANDVLASSFSIVPARAGWQEKAAMPAGPSGRQSKDGAWLALDSRTGVIYAAKGYKTGDFYSYDPQADTAGIWAQLAAVPDGAEGRPPYKGAAGTGDAAGHLFATKGNNTGGFWRYDIGPGGWQQLADVPYGAARQKVKGGTDLAYVAEGDTGYVYLLKGYRTDFFRFNTVSGAWDTTLPAAPTGARAKWDKGSWLAYDGDHTLYAHKAKYHELWLYDILSRSWATAALPGMPLVGMMGKSKKSRDGGAAAWARGSAWALKGGNTQEFWRWTAATGTWTELDTMPALGSSGRRKRVKNGGDIVAWSEGVFFALKGNKTNELWRYVAPAGALSPGSPLRSGAQSGGAATTVAGRRLSIAVPAGGPVSVRVFDASGRLVLRARVVRPQTAAVDLGGLRAGVYMVRLDWGTAGSTQRVVVH